MTSSPAGVLRVNRSWPSGSVPQGVANRGPLVDTVTPLRRGRRSILHVDSRVIVRRGGGKTKRISIPCRDERMRLAPKGVERVRLADNHEHRGSPSLAHDLAIRPGARGRPVIATTPTARRRTRHPAEHGRRTMAARPGLRPRSPGPGTEGETERVVARPRGRGMSPAVQAARAVIAGGRPSPAGVPTTPFAPQPCLTRMPPDATWIALSGRTSWVIEAAPCDENRLARRRVPRLACAASRGPSAP